jgi:hypothetical protein
VSFLRRVFGGGRADRERSEPSAGGPATAPPDEEARELDLLRAEQARLDPLRERQLRYADRSWTPPPQGGERRADDADADADAGGDRHSA